MAQIIVNFLTLYQMSFWDEWHVLSFSQLWIWPWECGCVQCGCARWVWMSATLSQYILDYMLPFLVSWCGVGMAKCPVRELCLFSNWMGMLKGSKENVFKKMNIFKNKGISQSILYIFLFCFLGPYSRTPLNTFQALESEKTDMWPCYLLTLIGLHKGCWILR